MPSNKILVNNPDDVEDVNSTLEAFRSCPSCKRDNAIITDPKSGENICSKCGMVVSDKLLESKQEWQSFAMLFIG